MAASGHILIWPCRESAEIADKIPVRYYDKVKERPLVLNHAAVPSSISVMCYRFSGWYRRRIQVKKSLNALACI